MSKTSMLPFHKIHTGDVIALPQQSKVGLVFAVVKGTNGAVDSFKIMPIHIHKGNFQHPNDANNFMLPKGIKEELHLSLDQKYRVEFTLEDYKVNPDDLTIRYAKGSATAFAGKTIARMDAKIREERRISAESEQEERVFVFHKDIPTHVKQRQKSGVPHRPDISIDDAHNFELIGETLHQVLSRGTYGRQQRVETLREAYDMANSPKAAVANRFAAILKTGMLATTVSLRTAFAEGIVNETESFNKLRDIDINRLGAAMSLFGVGKTKVNQKLLNNFIDEYDQEHFRIQPFLRADFDIALAWKTFQTTVVNDPKALQQQNIKYMYPT